MKIRLRVRVCAGLFIVASCAALAAGMWAVSTLNVPRSKEAANLATEVYTSLALSYFNFHSTNVVGFDAVFTIKKNGKPLGNMTVFWNRGDEKVSATLEGNADEKDKSAAESLLSGHVLSILVWGPLKSAIGSGPGVYAVKSGNEYVMDATEKSSKKRPEIESHFLFASADSPDGVGGRLRNLIARKDGTVLDMAYSSEAAEGKRFVSLTSTTGRSRGKVPWKVDVTFTYTHTEGTVFVKRAVTKRTAGNRTTTWTALLESVAFRKGIAGAASEKQTRDSRGETLRDRFWGEM